MRIRTLFQCVLAAVSIAACAHDRARPVPETVDIENLRSVPYATWTETKNDRAVSGVTVHDRRRAYAGYNVFTDDQNRAFLMDMNGRVVHQWRFDGARHCEFARVLPNGDALAVAVGQGLWKVDRGSNIKWIFRSSTNHDVDISEDGSIVVPASNGFATYNGRRVKVPTLAFLTPDGKQVDKWSCWSDEGPRLATYHKPLPLDLKPATRNTGGHYDYYHLNSVQLLPDTPLGRKDPRFAAGNLLVSLRNTNLVVVLDRQTKDVAWSWGPGQLDYQHAPVMLTNGHILIFDNGSHRKSTRVIEIAPPSGKVVWEYPRSGQPEFFSRWRGNAQRLPNGNTLICDADHGRAFEVTKKGETVWEFWSPFFNEESQRRRIYRMNRVNLDPAAFATGEPVPIESIPPPTGQPT